MRQFIVAAFALASLVLAGCETAPETAAERDALQDTAQATLKEMTAKDSTLRNVIDESAGYAIFPEVGKGAFVVGGAYGRGVVYQGGRFIGYADIKQGSVGLQAGGQTFTELLVFKTDDAVSRLKAGNFDVGANAEAVALKAGAAAEARFEKGVAVFIDPRGGLMAGVSLQGQKIDFVPAGQIGTSVQKQTNVRSEDRQDKNQIDVDVDTGMNKDDVYYNGKNNPKTDLKIKRETPLRD